MTSKKQKKLDAIFEKIRGLLETYTDEEPLATINFASRPSRLSDSPCRKVSGQSWRCSPQ